MDQPKMLRLLQLLMMLNGSRSYSLKELKSRTGMSNSTLYRYLDTIETAGFLLNRIDGRYNLKAEEKNVKSLNKLFHFSDEEAYLLYQTVSLIEKSSAVKEKLIKKLHTLYDFKTMAAAQNNEKVKLISTINAAIEQKKQLQIELYRSSNSLTIINRLVEPFQFLDDYAAVWCYDLADAKCKQFKLARMGSAQKAATNWENEVQHQIAFCDAFRLSAPAPIGTVTLIMTLKAYNLITEEYPMSQEFIKGFGENFELIIPVASYSGIGRFVLGLLDEIKLIGPIEFLDFLKTKRKLIDFH
jgi:predicted DNA-binding transcriptional regulator YafY